MGRIEREVPARLNSFCTELAAKRFPAVAGWSFSTFEAT
jgi:hypothetical protein